MKGVYHERIEYPKVQHYAVQPAQKQETRKDDVSETLSEKKGSQNQEDKLQRSDTESKADTVVSAEKNNSSDLKEETVHED